MPLQRSDSNLFHVSLYTHIPNYIGLTVVLTRVLLVILCQPQCQRNTDALALVPGWASITVNINTLSPLKYQDALSGPSGSADLYQLDQTLLSTNPSPQELCRKANTFCRCAMIKQVCLDPYPESVGFFLLIHYTCLGCCTCGYTPATPSCSLCQSSFFTEYSFFHSTHSHSSSTMFVHIQTSTADRVLSSPTPEVFQSPCESVHPSGC